MRQIGVGGFVASEKARKYVNEVLDAGRLSYGPFHSKFESAFAKEHQTKHALFCNSGTSALQIALQALKEKYGWSDGDEVIVPAITFVATSNVILHNRMMPVFVDVSANDYTINPDKIEKAITKKTRAIIPVHLLGLPADMTPIMEIARKHGLKVIEDSCETMFANCDGKRVGSIGDIGCFSTYVCHYIVTGVGGICTTNDNDLYVRMRSLMNHGRDSIYLSIDDDNESGDKLHEIAAKRFKFISVGHSMRCTELEAALGLAQLEEKDFIVRRRREIAEMLTAGLSGLRSYLCLPSIPEGRDHTFMLYGLVCRGFKKTRLINYLEDNGIETRDLMPLVNQPIYRSMFGDIEKNFPIAKILNESGFYIGCHQYMSDDDVSYIIERLQTFFKTP